MLFCFHCHLCNAATIFESARPNIGPLVGTICVAGGDLQVPRSVIADEEASDVLKAERLHACVVLECADLRIVVSVSSQSEAFFAYKHLKSLAPDHQLHILLTIDSLDRVNSRAEKRLQYVGRSVVQSGNHGILQLDHAVFLDNVCVLAQINDMCMASGST
jgi:hypothetical protein